MKRFNIFVFSFFILFLSAWLKGENEFSPEKAQAVEVFLSKIAKSTIHSVFLRKKIFSEDELNSYFNLIYLKKYAPEVKYIKLKLGKKNVVSGNLKVILSGKKYEQVPSMFRDFNIDFSGTIECQNYRMRFAFETMAINGTQFSPEMLDEAFAAAQINVEIKQSIFDWFKLLPGIKMVTVDFKNITFFY